MMYTKKSERVRSDQQLIAGVKKHFGKSKLVVLGGREVALADVIAMLEQRNALAAQSTTAKATWLTIAQNERELVEATQPVIDALRKYLVIVDGKTPTTTAQYGFTPRKRRGARKTATTTTATPPPAPPPPPPSTPQH